MSMVEALYQRAIDEMPALQKMARVEGALCWTRNLIARNVRAELGAEVSEERVKWEVALRMYQSDPRMEHLIREQIARVSA
jgi:hypothetical protein